MLQTGEYTYGKENLKIRGDWNNVTIGKYCSIAENCIIDGGFNHNTKFVSTYPFFNRFGIGHQNIVNKGDVVIGNDVWIGENVMIMGGVTIHDGAVIGANTLVTKDVRPYTIVVGSPNRETSYRFQPALINELLKIKWWGWPHTKVIENADLLSSENINDFIIKHRCVAEQL
jgi:acetyltransferase-like isoleucine patch superfamily enzyme